ncbi:MAG: sulfotransferase [Cyanothece sp. SIO1E1]|nr:sulfotransferase [Cyanothece sp. SIO1E1]
MQSKIMRRLATKISQTAFDIQNSSLVKLFNECDTEYQNSVFLAGTGRSGTTWLSNIINSKKRYRYIFEPFNPHAVSLCNNFNSKQYIRADCQNSLFYEPVKQILSGSFRNKWSDRYCQNILSKRRLIKSVRANLFLKWLHDNFPNLPIILIIRNPIAVANSRAKLDWGTSLGKYLCQDDLMQDYLAPFQNELQQAQKYYQKNKNIFENSIFTWCIEHYVPLKQFQYGEIKIVFYEEILGNPEPEIRSLMSFIGQNYDNSILKEFENPSQMSRKDSAINLGKNSVDIWKNDVGKNQIQKAKEILDIFGLKNIYPDNLPSRKELERVMKAL